MGKCRGKNARERREADRGPPQVVPEKVRIHRGWKRVDKGPNEEDKETQTQRTDHQHGDEDGHNGEAHAGLDFLLQHRTRAGRRGEERKMSTTSAKAFELKVLRRSDDQEARDEARLRRVLGHRKSKAYARMLERAKVPRAAMKYLPAMKPVETCEVGSETRRLLKRIEFNFENKPRKLDRALDQDAANENHLDEQNNNNDDNINSKDEGDKDDEDSSAEESDSDEEESDSDEELHHSGADASSSSSTSSGDESDESSEQEAANLTQLDKWDNLAEEFRPSKKDEPPCVAIGRMHAADPAEYVVPDLSSVGQDLDLGVQEEPVVPGLPGFAAQPRPIAKSRGAEPFFNYVGRWEAGSLCGEGVYVFADGETYRGGWLNNLPHGHGVAKYPDGSSYEGEWSQGAKHGTGVYMSADKSRYEGAFENGRRTGHGKVSLASKLTYEGAFVDGKFHGRGVMKSPLGWEYSGTWSRGRIHGTGAIVNPEGERTVKTWRQPISFHRAVRKLKEDTETRFRRKNEFRVRLRAFLFEQDVQRHVRRIRDDMAQAELDRIEEERKELNRLRYERREQLRKAKEDALNGIESGDEGSNDDDDDDDNDDDDDDDDEDDEDDDDDEEEEEDEEEEGNK